MTDLRNYWTPERRAADPWGYRADLFLGALLPVTALLLGLYGGIALMQWLFG